MLISVPKHTKCTLRSNGEFTVWLVNSDGQDDIIGPDSAAHRQFSFESGSEAVKLRVTHRKETVITQRFQGFKAPFETPDPTPTKVMLNRPATMNETIQAMVFQALNKQAQDEGFETIEESNDFDVEEDDTPLTQYEHVDMDEEVYLAPPASEEVKPGTEAPEGPKEEKSQESGSVSEDGTISATRAEID